MIESAEVRSILEALTSDLNRAGIPAEKLYIKKLDARCSVETAYIRREYLIEVMELNPLYNK